MQKRHTGYHENKNYDHGVVESHRDVPAFIGCLMVSLTNGLTRKDGNIFTKLSVTPSNNMVTSRIWVSGIQCTIQLEIFFINFGRNDYRDFRTVQQIAQQVSLHDRLEI